MNRLRLFDLRMSRLPSVLGLCRADVLEIAEFVNAAELRLLMAKESGDEGWWGTWAEMAFNVPRTSPFITTPRGVARIEAINVCKKPIVIQNQFYEYLTFGNGRLPKDSNNCRVSECLTEIVQVMSRNNKPTFVDLVNGPKIIRIFLTDSADIGKRVLMQGTDQNDKTIYTQDGLNRVLGQFVVMDSPFVDATFNMNSITGIQKDVTNGPVEIHEVDPTTGTDTLLLTMEPGEEVANYRRYFLNALPLNCCSNSTVTTVSVTCIAKLEHIPVVVDTDYTLIQNREAIIEEAQCIRYESMDTTTAKQMAAIHHKNAIGLLNGELAHYLGTDQPAIDFKPFGSARLSKKKIGSLM